MLSQSCHNNHREPWTLIINSRYREKGGEACLSVWMYDADICKRTRNLSKGGKRWKDAIF